MDGYIVAKYCKPNIISSKSSHFGISDFYYSFGNQGNYGMQDNSYVKTYVNNMYKGDEKEFDTKVHAKKQKKDYKMDQEMV